MACIAYGCKVAAADDRVKSGIYDYIGYIFKLVLPFKMLNLEFILRNAYVYD